MHEERTRTILTEAIEALGLQPSEVAARLGLQGEGVLNMMLQGITRVPLHLIPRLSCLLEIDEQAFIATATEEYHPELFKGLTRLPGISREDVELGLLTMCRRADLRRPQPKA